MSVFGGGLVEVWCGLGWFGVFQWTPTGEFLFGDGFYQNERRKKKNQQRRNDTQGFLNDIICVLSGQANWAA